MKYQLETLTPVHVGSGENLQHIDGCYADKKWHRIDLDKVFADPDTNLNVLTLAMGKQGFRWTTHLQNPDAFATYSLPCSQSPEEVEIREAIKQIDHRPFIPGSTLKGAIRTALLWDLINGSATHYKKTLSNLEKLVDPKSDLSKERAARQIEQDVLGRDPNRDLLRALQISDTAPIELSALEIGTAWTVTLNSNDYLVQKVEGNREYKTCVEQIQPKQVLTFSLKIDEWLLKEPVSSQLSFGDSQGDAIRNIAAVCHWVTGDLIRREQKFFNAYNFPQIANFYDKLLRLNERLTDGSFLLQIGWGTGYDSKTITPLFTHDENDPEAAKKLLMDLRKRFRLGQSRSGRETYDEREFPKTRRIFYSGQNPVSPFGWVKISPLGTEA